MFQELDQLNIGVKSYSPNTEIGFSVKILKFALAAHIRVRTATVTKPSIRSVTINVQTLRPVTIF